MVSIYKTLNVTPQVSCANVECLNYRPMPNNHTINRCVHSISHDIV